MDKGRILVVDDDQFYHDFCTEILGGEGYDLRTAYTGEEALEILKNADFDVILLDLVMPGMGGADVLDRARQLRPEIDVVIMTGYASVESAVQCLKSGAADYLTKPLNPEVVKLTVKRTIELRHLFDENLELRNLLNLYETCQRVSLCLDLEKLYHLSLDAVLQALQGDSALSFFKQNGNWEVKSFRGMEEEEAESMKDALLANDLREFPDRVKIVDGLSLTDEGNPGCGTEACSAVIIPISVPQMLDGVIVAFRNDEKHNYDRMDLGTARFISEQIHLSFENAMNYEDAQRLVFVDDLTGLFNTRYLDMALDTELKRAKRFKSHLSLLFLDLDFFKKVNDTYGHLAGSKLLIETAKLLNSLVRDIDIVIRYGGDEFILILIETDRNGALKVAERVRKTVEEHQFRIKDDLILKSTCCVGVATYPDDAESKSELIHLADKAMYRGKETTRNVVYASNAI